MTDNQEATANEKKYTGGGISMRLIGAVAIIIAIALAFFAFSLAGYITDANEGAQNDSQRYAECSQAIYDLQMTSDYLTTQARLYVTTGREASIENYIYETDTEKRRGRAVEVLKKNFESEQDATKELEHALDASNELAKTEFTAMRLAADYYGTKNLPAQVANAELDASMQNLQPDAKLQVAKELVLGDSYAKQKEEIQTSVKASSDALLNELNTQVEKNNTTMQNLLFQLRIAVALLLCVVMILVLVLLMYVLKPLSRYIKLIEKSEPLEPFGAYELKYLANAYNTMYEDNNQRIAQLRAFAERDPLTGISNRSGYENFLATHTRNIALLLIDIDNFKEFNSVYGQDTGDAVLIKLAAALGEAFRSTDFPCRLYGDRFAVIMTNVGPELRDAIDNKIEIVNSIISDDSDDLPVVTLSVGAAFSAPGMNDQDIFRAASEALDQAHKAGRNRTAFYGEND